MFAYCPYSTGNKLGRVDFSVSVKGLTSADCCSSFVLGDFLNNEWGVCETVASMHRHKLARKACKSEATRLRFAKCFQLLMFSYL